MKHGLIALLAILVVALLPSVVPAQGLPTLPGLPSFGSLFGGGDSCEEAGPGPLAIDGSVGWNYQTIDLDFRTLDFGFGAFGAANHEYRFNGLKLGVTATAVSRNGFGAMANFSILATGNTRDPETYNEGLPAPVFFQGTRNWRAKNDTYSVTGMGFYNLYRSAALVGGFRWDHLETTFDNPSATPGILSLPGDEASLSVNIYQPFVGVLLDQGGADRVLRLGAIVWPQLYGSAKYGQTFGAFGTGTRFSGLTGKVNEGYFWEVFGEYGLRGQMFMGAALSVFGSWTQYHLKGNFNADTEAVGLGTTGSDLMNISMHRNSWTAGLKLDVPFALPMPGYF